MSPINLNQTNNKTQESLTQDQKNTIESVLNQFDPNNLSDEDAISIVSAFNDANIQASAELKNTMESFGFDARKVGEQAGVERQSNGGQGMPPPPQNSGINQENFELLQSILEQYEDLSKLSDQDKVNLSEELLQAGLLEPGALINTTR